MKGVSKKATMKGYAEHLSREGENLSLVTEFLYKKYPSIFDTVLKRLSERVPGIDKVEAKITEEGRVLLRFKDCSLKGGQTFVSTHSPDFLNAVELNEVFWLVKKNGYTTIKRAKDNKQLSAYMSDGDKMGYLWKQGFFDGVDN